MSVNDPADLSWTEWCPQQLLNGDLSKIFIILNQPLLPETKDFLQRHWNSALLRVVVDGGTHHLREVATSLHKLIPDIVCGDFDSALPENLDYYKKMGAQIIHTPDQNETDFTKALKISTKYFMERQMQVDAILVISRCGDRVDHILGNMDTLYLALKISPAPVFIVGDNSLTWLLKEGKHKMHVSKELLNSHIGLIPLGEPCFDVTTTGLKWNLCHSHMEFGGFISICNKFNGPEVTIENDKKLLWTMEISLE